MTKQIGQQRDAKAMKMIHGMPRIGEVCDIAFSARGHELAVDLLGVRDDEGQAAIEVERAERDDDGGQPEERHQQRR